jgi:transposase-like protein
MKFTITDFNERYPDEDACLAEIMRQRYGTISACPSCEKQTKFHRVKGRRCYECQWCGKQIYPTKGTIFEKSTTPLKLWFYAMYLMTASRHGVPAKELERQLGVTYKTAWRMAHAIRKLMGSGTPIKLKGHIEVDETYVGGKERNKHKSKKLNAGRGTVGKTAVFGMIERGDEENKSIVKAKVLEDVQMSTLTKEIMQYVESGTTISTDEFKSYNALILNGFVHSKVQHSANEYVNGICHTNNIEGFWSRLKVSISGTHVWVSRKHLQLYVDEFAFRYNARGNPSKMFEHLISHL